MACRTPEEARLIFVVPADKFDTFHKQQIRGSELKGTLEDQVGGDGNDGQAGRARYSHVKQFALKLDWPSSTSNSSNSATVASPRGAHHALACGTVRHVGAASSFARVAWPNLKNPNTRLHKASTTRPVMPAQTGQRSSTSLRPCARPSAVVHALVGMHVRF